MAIGWMDQHIPAIIDAWYPGEQGGTAIAEVLFGDYNPAGRLPLTFYNSIEDLPDFDDYNVKNNRTYMYFEGKPLYAFGYGLSYTKFDYRNLNIKQDTQNVTLNFSIKNSGKYNGEKFRKKNYVCGMTRRNNSIHLREHTISWSANLLIISVCKRQRNYNCSIRRQADIINSHLNTVNAEILILNKERYSPHFFIITVRLK